MTDGAVAPVAGNRILHPQGWPRARGYANGVAAEGRIVVTGGVVGWRIDGSFPADFVGQARQTFENIAAILAEGGATPEHIVRLTWYVTDMDTYLADPKGLGDAYRSLFGRHFPAMAAVQVVRLVEAAAMIEIEATAIVPFEIKPIA
ncbi:RidA family protein [Beijerinckia sp. L45]|uniref:RidA family protein n=1 Tax=Beijerinckia sp. L45 TaxID=1641855 RepID=UPI001FEF4F69|nr:RidA family protein [Beijerinckia sp. L45]